MSTDLRLVRSEDLTLNAAGQRLAATKVLPAGVRRPRILTLHGLGPTVTRHGIRYLQDYLAIHGHGSMCFEFSGNGESSGVLGKSSLRRRRQEVLAAAAQLDAHASPVLIGTSMGAHLASWLAPVVRPGGLVLFCPAAYPADAVDSRFNGELARPGPYADSPAFAGIREFPGDLLIVAAAHDQVVPASVVQMYKENARIARSTRVIWLDCDHFIHRYLPSHDAARAKVCRAIRQLVADTHE
jgi:uncharacterized protein